MGTTADLVGHVNTQHLQKLVSGRQYTIHSYSLTTSLQAILAQYLCRIVRFGTDIDIMATDVENLNYIHFKYATYIHSDPLP